jgi:DAK2 domain fusion protein YloV
LLRGLADEVAAAAREGRPAGPRVLAAAFAEAGELAWQAVGVPSEGTMLTVARAAAEAAGAVADGTAAGAPGAEPTFAAVAEAARDAAEAALERTPEQLAVLREHGVVDAGGRGLCVLIDVLAALLGGYDPERAVPARRVHMRPASVTAQRDALADSSTTIESAIGTRGPGFEVIYLVDTSAERLAELRTTVESLCADGAGDSLVIAGGAGTYRLHVHVEQPGPVIEAAIRLGRPYDLRITSLTECADAAVPAAAGTAGAEAAADYGPGMPIPGPGRIVLAAAPGPGIAELFEQAGAVPLSCQPGRPPTSAQLTRAVVESAVAEVIVLVNDGDGLAAAAAAAEQVHRGATGVRVAVVPSKAVVQGIAALAVHEPGRRFDSDIVAMTAAAGATRHGALQIAADDAWTMAGVCHAGDVLGLIEGDVALIAPSVREAAFALVDRMVSAGGEMVTLVTGDGLGEEDLVEAVTARVHTRRPEMDVVAYDGGQSGWPLLIGVE